MAEFSRTTTLRPVHLVGLSSDHHNMQSNPAGMMSDIEEHVKERLRRTDALLKLLDMPAPASAEELDDPLVHVTQDHSLPTSVFFPHALEGAAKDCSAQDLRSWAQVCHAWSGWTHRLLRDPSALRWLWCRLVLAYIEDLDLARVLHPQLADRTSLRVTLQEQRLRDWSVFSCTQHVGNSRQKALARKPPCGHPALQRQCPNVSCIPAEPSPIPPPLSMQMIWMSALVQASPHQCWRSTSSEA